MADKFRSGISALPEFVDGENPSATKFSSTGVQAKRALNLLEKAVGDLWGESWPYRDDSSHHMTQPYGRELGTGDRLAGASVYGRPLDIVNLARLVGPASNLNPQVLPLEAKSITDEVIASGVHEFSLAYPPDDPSLVTFTDPGSALQSYKGSPELLAANGDYHCTDDGVVYCFKATGSGTKATYATSPLTRGGGTHYPGARFNVIPDPNQVEAGSSEQLAISGPDGDGRYQIQLPRITHQVHDSTEVSTALSAARDPNYNVQLSLPTYLVDVLSSGDTIPEGLVLLRNNTTGEIYKDATYLYSDLDTLEVQGVDLGDGYLEQDFSLLVVGTDITTTLSALSWRLFRHDHSRGHGEPGVPVSGLTGILAQAGLSGVFCPSEMPSNHFPQFLHRDGWRSGYDDANANDQNCMRGPLVMGLSVGTPGSYLADTGESFRLRFGSGTKSPSLHRGGNNALWILGQQDLGVENDVRVTAYGSLYLKATDLVPNASEIVLHPTDGIDLTSPVGDIDLSATTGNINLVAATDLVLRATDDVIIETTDDFHCKVDWDQGSGSGRVKFYDLGEYPTGSAGPSASPSVPFYVEFSHGSGYLASFKNGADSINANGIKIQLQSADGTPTGTNHFLSFQNRSGTTYGEITGSEDGNRNAFFSYYSGSSHPAEDQAVVGVAVLTGVEGNVQFVSGSADYGEWLALGDLSEWGIDDLDAHQKFVFEHKRFGLEEGCVVWVRGAKFYKSGPGTPMVVTCRAMVVGNAGPCMNDVDAIGEVLSFIGQVPVLVEGAVRDGDLLVPVPGESHCRAVPPDCSFEKYRCAIGTAWGTSQDERVKRVLCAIRVK